MSRREIFFLSSLIVSIITISILVTGSSLLTIALDKTGKIPLGTFITWAGMVALPLTIYWGIRELRKPTKKLNVVLASLLKLLIILGVLWVPISYLLAGNLSFSFSEKETFQGGQIAMKWFWYLSYGIGIGTILILIAYWITLLFKKIKLLMKKYNKLAS